MWRMRRYELMLVFKPDAPDERTQAVVERVTRMIVGDGGQIVKVQPWGRRRLAYPIDRHREGQYHIVVFEAPPTTIGEIERSLLITEEVLRHLLIRVERPVRSARKGEATETGDGDQVPPPPADDEEVEPDGELIDESESEAAPAAVD
jgi:small subunit ribosomal protein S6